VLRGDLVLLRAVERADVEVLAAVSADPVTWHQVDDAPYVPKTVADALKAYDEGTAGRAADAVVPFVVDVGGTPVGRATLWGIDPHNRHAHLGINLAPSARGRGYGTDAVRVLLRYAFRERGLHRVQLEVLADNAPALASYRKAGFVEEGRLREDAWVDGGFVDMLVMSVLADEWLASHPPQARPE
jgi:RimJ/RimL family protein N-acetyltransferase